MDGRIPVLLLARSDITGIGQLTAEAILISTQTPFDPNFSRSQSLRVPWNGGPVETVYDASMITPGFSPRVSVAAVVAGQTTWIVRRDVGHFFWQKTSIVALRDGIARKRYESGGDVQTIVVDEEAFTFGIFNASGLRTIERLCAVAPKSRAVR